MNGGGFAHPRPRTAVIKTECIAARLGRPPPRLSSAPPSCDIFDLTLLEPKKMTVHLL